MHVRAHYDRHRPRAHDHMLPVRKLHNFVKMCLIRSGGEPRRVLDLCCGNGGDLHKLRSVGCREYFGIDLSDGAVERALERLRDAPPPLRGDVVVADCFGDEVHALLRQMRPFDMVNCQFALHYAFGSEACARAAFRNVAAALAPGGTLVGTVADGDKLDRLRASLGKKFGDRYFRVAFVAKQPAAFGDAYEFTFKGAVEQLTEYATRRETFAALAAESGLALTRWENMETYARQMRADDPRMYRSMGCDEAIQTVTGIYAVFSCTRRAPEKV